MPMIVKHRSNLEVCSVSRAGIGMVQAIVEKLRWKIGDRVQVGFIGSAKCLLLRPAPTDDGFRLAYANTRKKTGGRIFCNAFVRNYLATIIELPKRNILPILLSSSEWSVALLLEPMKWQSEEFSKNGANAVGKDAIGVYELLGNQDLVVRIGEGKIRDRIAAHLMDERFRPPAVKSFRHLALDDPADSPLMEKILLRQYEAEIGVLPRFQEIRS
ncbi:MAG: hypothetical protein HJJLKODD_01996 [Phycisphaerae bacterium]|nr:hypothetical protein [Phycisphaerae bacterium]